MPVSLSAWETFYVITGSSGAALTGLMFVVIALAADRSESTTGDGVGAYTTPTVTHFSIVLLLAGIMTMPVHRVLSLSICLAGAALAGLASASIAGMRMNRLRVYTAVSEDWTWHVILPGSAYVVLLAGALVLGWAEQTTLEIVAAVALALLFIGIHNAWDVAVYLAVGAGTRPDSAAVRADPPAAAGPAPTPAPPPPPVASPVAAGDHPAPSRPG